MTQQAKEKRKAEERPAPINLQEVLALQDERW